MNLAQLITIALQLSIFAVVFSVALRATPGEILSLLRRPGLLVRSVLAMNIVMPVFAALIAAIFDLRPAVEAALILLAVAPVPPLVPRSEVKAGGSATYAVSLLAVSAIVALVTVPLSVTLIGRLFGHELNVPVGIVARVLGISVLLPLVAGFVVRNVAPTFAARFAGLIAKIAMVVLVIGIVPILAVFWRGITAQVGDFSIVAFAVFTLVALAVGHVLGGPAPDERSVLAISTARRHPGLAMAVAGAIFEPEQKGLVAAAVLLCVLVGVIVTIPYTKWWQRTHPAPVAAAR